MLRFPRKWKMATVKVVESATTISSKDVQKVPKFRYWDREMMECLPAPTSSRELLLGKLTTPHNCLAVITLARAASGSIYWKTRLAPTADTITAPKWTNTRHKQSMLCCRVQILPHLHRALLRLVGPPITVLRRSLLSRRSAQQKMREWLTVGISGTSSVT